MIDPNEQQADETEQGYSESANRDNDPLYFPFGPDPELDEDNDPIFDDDEYEGRICPECHGSGLSWDHLCNCIFCAGDGVID